MEVMAWCAWVVIKVNTSHILSTHCHCLLAYVVCLLAGALGLRRLLEDLKALVVQGNEIRMRSNERLRVFFSGLFLFFHLTFVRG